MLRIKLECVICQQFYFRIDRIERHIGKGYAVFQWIGLEKGK